MLKYCARAGSLAPPYVGIDNTPRVTPAALES